MKSGRRGPVLSNRMLGSRHRSPTLSSRTTFRHAVCERTCKSVETGWLPSSSVPAGNKTSGNTNPSFGFGPRSQQPRQAGLSRTGARLGNFKRLVSIHAPLSVPTDGDDFKNRTTASTPSQSFSQEAIGGTYERYGHRQQGRLGQSPSSAVGL